MSSTINDVAKLAGVSRQTVSRVINNSPLVKPETIVEVQKAITLLDYHPNAVARNLAIKTVKTVGLFMPFDVEQVRQNMFFSTISATICHYYAKQDFVLQLFTSPDDRNYSELFKKLYREKRVGGLILTCPSVNNEDVMELLAAKIPFVIIGRPGLELEQINYVDVDNVKAAYLAVQRMLELGHRKICLLNAPSSMTLAVDIRKGAEEAYREASMPIGNLSEMHIDLTLKSAYEATLHVMSRDDRPTAFVTADDLIVLGIKKATDQLNLSIPTDLSVISVIKNGWADLLPMPLTYIDASFEDLGTRSAQFMLKTISEPEKKHMMQKKLKPELIVGGTCTRVAMPV
ncbi:LacI family DNA-binding transcriptional regulator [Paenibacillus agaridevorans]|uniref:LacI family DNA-binding transcriptional regulator n=1 Tax=Paenibacillus agaridevorans TaxID=171404 RepID=UPI001BE4D082|nr:LacI family DNA-binding transcriptional regulator [Paenibacillus agaridevorans]